MSEQNQDSSSNKQPYNPWLNRMWIHYFTLQNAAQKLENIIDNKRTNGKRHEAAKNGLISIEIEMNSILNKLSEEDDG